MKKVSQFLLLLVAPIVLFHRALENLLDATIVKYLYVDFQPSLGSEICLFVIGILILYYYINRPKNYIPDYQRTGLIFIWTLIYISYRFLYAHWIFVGLATIPWLKYSDIVLLLPLGETFLVIRSFFFKRTVILPVSAFYGNRPITKKQEDKLGYQNYADVIANRLNESRFDEAFAIGINGKWGSGKTSFMNLVKERIDKSDRLIIDFKPWNAHEPQAILKDFFETVHQSISPYHATLASEIRDYGKKLAELHDNSVSKGLSAAFDLLTSDNNSLSNQYEQINQGLKKIDRQLIICIDDLDRLDKKEINEVIRLIRNTANFYNTVFLAAYDRDYLLSAIKELNEHNYQHFLEKIFQLEVNLPGFATGILRDYLKEEIVKVFGRSHELECHAAVDELYTYKVNILGDWIASIRDINHVLNSLVVNAVQIKEEILITDILKLELLRYRYPQVYIDLFNRSEHWLDSERPVFSNEEPIYMLKTGGRENNLSSDLANEHGPYQLRQTEIRKIVRLIEMLFKPAFIRTGQEYLSVKYPLNFSKYFHYSLRKNQLSNKEFYDARASELPVFKEKILQWLMDGQAIQLHRLFQRIDDISGQQDFEKVIRAIIYMSNVELPRRLYSALSKYAFKLENFADRLHDHKYKISNDIYQDKKAKDGKFKTFVKSLFDEAAFPYFYEAQVLNYFKTDLNIENSPLTHEEIKGYLFKYFADFLTKVEMFSYDEWRFLDIFKSEGQVDYEGKEPSAPNYHLEALRMFKEHIAKHLDDFLLLMISPSIHKKNVYVLSDYALQLFLTHAAFEEFITVNQAGSEYFPEFKQFLHQYQEAGRKYIKFNFTTIPVKKTEDL